MIVTKYTGAGGGGGYVLPTATASRLGGIKVGSGLSVENDGTLSADGGAGGGDYIVTEALSSITNPTEGMIAYVPAHYEDRGATHIKFELNDTSENVELWYPDFLYFDNDWNKWEKFQSYFFDATNNEKSRAEFRKDDGFRKTELISSDAWFSPSLASQVLVKVSGATIEFLVDSSLTISSTQNPDDKFTVTTSTGLTPVRGMTYVYHSGWILKDVDFAYDRFADYMPSCLSLIKNRNNEQELGFGLWGINFDTKYWFNIDAEGQPLGWGGFSFSCVSTEDNTQIKYEVFVETDGSSWNPNARVTDMKPLEVIQIPVLYEDAVLTEDIEYEGQIVAHSGDTVASAGTIVAETDLYNAAAYDWQGYGKSRVILQFVKPGECSWNNDLQQVIVNPGEPLNAYSDILSLQRVAVEGEPEDYYISAIMDKLGTTYRGSWKQHDRYTRWITLSWTQIQ